MTTSKKDKREEAGERPLRKEGHQLDVDDMADFVFAAAPDGDAVEQRASLAWLAICSGLIAPSKEEDSGRVRELASEMHIALDAVLTADLNRRFDSFGPEFERMAALVRNARERGLTKAEILQVIDETAARIKKLGTSSRFGFEMAMTQSGDEFKRAYKEILAEE